jgi:tRNA A37 threonylcarbamoyltransferase TsaD
MDLNEIHRLSGIAAETEIKSNNLNSLRRLSSVDAYGEDTAGNKIKIVLTERDLSFSGLLTYLQEEVRKTSENKNKQLMDHIQRFHL